MGVGLRWETPGLLLSSELHALAFSQTIMKDWSKGQGISTVLGETSMSRRLIIKGQSFCCDIKWRRVNEPDLQENAVLPRPRVDTVLVENPAKRIAGLSWGERFYEQWSVKAATMLVCEACLLFNATLCEGSCGSKQSNSCPTAARRVPSSRQAGSHCRPFPLGADRHFTGS